ncbi:MAG TPA: phage integrase N-terminal SAM-like domain-containing protein, partial [Candidatus Aquilonibacter sp.]|nr:phage integrase N-terminal SAM-like domain-containing protein [Candidatus Aquilonibacter sp.]
FISNPKLRFMDQCRQTMRFRHLALRSEQAYLEWIKRFIFFHDKRHPKHVITTQIYTHVMQKPGLGVKSPVDG